jgi:hypothetical protein
MGVTTSSELGGEVAKIVNEGLTFFVALVIARPVVGRVFRFFVGRQICWSSRARLVAFLVFEESACTKRGDWTISRYCLR